MAFSYVPIRAASLLGISLNFCGLLYATGIVFGRLVFGIRVEGWASLMVVLLIVSGTQLLMSGILGEYLWRNLDETRRRPRFIVERVIECSDARHPDAAQSEVNTSKSVPTTRSRLQAIARAAGSPSQSPNEHDSL